MKRRERWLGVALGALLSMSACGAHPNDAVIGSNSVRLVTPPSSIALLSAAQVTIGLPAEIRLGGPLGRSALYLKFPQASSSHDAPLQASLALSAREGAPEDSTPVTLEVWRVTSEWRAADLKSWTDKPDMAPPYARLEVKNSPAEDVRIDVSELVRFAARNPQQDFGMALIARGGPGHGVSFATGMNGGWAPRLEVFYAR